MRSYRAFFALRPWIAFDVSQQDFDEIAHVPIVASVVRIEKQPGLVTKKSLRRRAESKWLANSMDNKKDRINNIF